MSKLRVNDVIPANGLNIGIGTAGGNFIVGGASTTVVVNGTFNSTGNSTFDGNIGIGTDNPYNSKLQVFGKQRVSASAKNLTTDFFVLSSTENSSNSNDLIFRQRAADNDWEIEAVEQGIAYRNVWIKNGNLKFTSGKGIDFSAAAGSASGSTSALLDDYEEGTFVPIARGRTTAGTTTYSRAAVGKYVKIGRLVNVMVDMVFGSATGTGNLEIAGLPFAAHSGPYVRFAGSVTLLNAGISWSNQIAPYINDTLSHFWITNTPTSGNYTFVDINSSTTEILLNCTYMVD